MADMDELILKARAVELIRAEKQKARFRKTLMCMFGGLAVGIAVGVTLTVLFLNL